jgi:hemolysin III
MESQPHSPAEELANAITHGMGLVGSVVGAVVLMDRALAQSDRWRALGCGIFAATLIAVYAASTLSHACALPGWRRTFRILDQSFIYLLIVGSYTPFALAYLHSGWWWLFFGVLWGVAFVGLISKLLFLHRIDAVTIWSYLVLGWLPILPTPAYLELVPHMVLALVFIGGLCYTIGTVFLVLDRRWPFCHAIWHLWVVAGSVCHFTAVFWFVATAPPPALAPVLTGG